MLILHQYCWNLSIWTPIENKTVTVGVLEDGKFCKSMLQTVLLQGSFARIFYKEIWYLCLQQAAKLLLLQTVNLSQCLLAITQIARYRGCIIHVCK